MSNEETPKIEPTLTPITDAPSVAPSAEIPAPDAVKPDAAMAASSAQPEAQPAAPKAADVLAEVARANARASGVLQPEVIAADAAAARANAAAAKPDSPASKREAAGETAKPSSSSTPKPAANLTPASRLYIEPKPEKEEPRIERNANPRPGAGARQKGDSKQEPYRPAVILRMAGDRGDGPDVVMRPRIARFALLAASMAIAACGGAVAGSFGVTYFGHFAKAPEAPVVAKVAAKDATSDEVKALKDTVTQLRATTKALSDNLAALKNTVSTSNTTQNTQISKISETLERVEKSQTEQRKAAVAAAAAAAQPVMAQAQPVAETTGSVLPRPPANALPAIEPNGALKQAIVQGYSLRRVYDGAALIEGREGMIEVEIGAIVPGLGRIENIKRQDGRWVVVTARGLVVAH